MASALHVSANSSLSAKHFIVYAIKSTRRSGVFDMVQ